MVGKFGMRAGQIELGHVAAGAAARAGAADRCSAARGVTGAAFDIVGFERGLEGPVRVVAGGALDAAVGSVVALGSGEPVRLEADVLNPARSVRRDLRPRAMALAAEVGQLFRGQRGKLLHGRAGTQMGFGAPVAALAQDTRDRLLCAGAGRVTVEA